MTDDNNIKVDTLHIVNSNDNNYNLDYADYETIYKKAYSIVGDKTPLNTDCGVLCDKICCQSEDSYEEKGMFLFPGEEIMYTGLPSSDWILKPTEIEYYPGKNITLIICNGNCDREKRPLACRIFPLAGVINKDNKLSIVMDSRGKSMCPIAYAMKVEEIDVSFVKSVVKGLKYLLPYNEMKEYLMCISKLIDEDEVINQMFL